MYSTDEFETAGPSEFYSMEGKKKETGITQIDYLQRLHQVHKMLLTAEMVVPETLFIAILRALNEILADRKSMPRVRGCSRVTNWTSKWFFEFPVYDSALMRYSNAQQKWLIATRT